MNKTFTEGRHTAEYLVSEANGMRSREQGVVAEDATHELEAGTVLGMVGGKYVALDPSASSTGAEVAAAILYSGVDATDDDADCVVHVRDCEVDANALVWPDAIAGGEKTTAIAELEALGIIVR